MPKVEPKSQPEKSLAETTVILNLELGKVTNRRKLDSNTKAVDTDIDRDMLHLSVDLFDAEELEKCQNFLYTVKAAVRAKTVPSFLRGGMYMVKHEAVEEVDSILEKAEVDFAPLVQAFADVVDKRRDESKERLGPAYNAGAYPSKAQVIEAFRIKWAWYTLGTPTSLKQISKALFERERQKAEENLKAAVEDIVVLLGTEAKKLADHMVDRLTPGDDGKPKVFRNSMVSNITEFLANFNLRNVGTNEELNHQIDRMRVLMTGISPDDLRKSDRLRSDVATGFSKVAGALDQLVITKPVRFIEKS